MTKSVAAVVQKYQITIVEKRFEPVEGDVRSTRRSTEALPEHCHRGHQGSGLVHVEQQCQSWLDNYSEIHGDAKHPPKIFSVLRDLDCFDATNFNTCWQYVIIDFNIVELNWSLIFLLWALTGGWRSSLSFVACAGTVKIVLQLFGSEAYINYSSKCYCCSLSLEIAI